MSAIDIMIIADMSAFELDMRSITAVRPLFELRKRYAISYKLAFEKNDQEGKAEALRGLDYANEEIMKVFHVPFQKS